MRGATLLDNPTLFATDFNPRTPCGVRPVVRWFGDGTPLFQSTHPMRGATAARHRIYDGRIYFNPRTSCGVRRYVSIYYKYTLKFQSTHPMRGATAGDRRRREDSKISIHAPHAGCDRSTDGILCKKGDFNPRTPCGVRLLSSGVCVCACYFNPRTPCGVRHADMRHAGRVKAISIHAPHAGCDSKTRQNHHVPLHKTYIVYQIFISLALYLLMFFKQKIKIAQNSGAKSCVLL